MKNFLAVSVKSMRFSTFTEFFLQICGKVIDKS